MRISVDRRDSGYRTYLANLLLVHSSKVILDEQKLESCITVDEELGEVLVLVCDAAGIPIVKDRIILTEWRRGRVEVILPDLEAS